MRRGRRGQGVAKAPGNYRSPELNRLLSREPSCCQGEEAKGPLHPLPAFPLSQGQSRLLHCHPGQSFSNKDCLSAQKPRPKNRRYVLFSSSFSGPWEIPRASGAWLASHKATCLASSQAEVRTGPWLPSFSHVLLKALNS